MPPYIRITSTLSHPPDTIATEGLGTRGRPIWVHSSGVELLDTSAPQQPAGEAGGVGNGRRGQPMHRTLLPRPDLSWPSPDAQVGRVRLNCELFGGRS